MSWLEEDRGREPTASLYKKLIDERILWDPSRPEQLEQLRRDVARVAADMDDPDKPPPMFWSGIPLPPRVEKPSCGYQLIISIGGTKTDFGLLRMEKGEVIGLDVLTGDEVKTPDEIHAVKRKTEALTPKYGPRTPNGQAMVAQLVDHLAPHIERQRSAFERCEAILLSWGFPHSVIRTGEKIAGGLTARVTKMTKEQAEFTESLRGQKIGGLLEAELLAQTGWSRPIAVANDTVMALHYFLAAERRDGHARVGLFIVGTGTNFSAAEPYAVRPQGFLSRGEDYEPARLTAERPVRTDETVLDFFVNYEAGSLDLVETRTRFDVDPNYPIEQNALAGGNAFSQQFQAYVEEFVSQEAYERVRSNWREIEQDPKAVPAGPAVSRIVAGDDADILRGLEKEPDAAAKIRLISRAIVTRSALHAALVLAAITHRTGFGLGADGKPDLLGMEGSVWKTPHYPELVTDFWQTLVGETRLSVDLQADPNYNASLSGPLYLAALHR